MKSLTHTRRIVIRREDHIGERVGAIFLKPEPENQDWMFDLVRAYLGGRVRIRKLELLHDRLEVELTVQALNEEAARLAAAANELRKHGAPRNALEMFRRALELDQFCHPALAGAGAALAELKQHGQALAMFKRAREIAHDNADLLLTMAYSSLKLDKLVNAIGYLERAYELAPAHFGVRRALIELGRRPKPPPRQTRTRMGLKSGNHVHAQ